MFTPWLVWKGPRWAAAVAPGRTSSTRLCMALMLRELLHKDQHFILRNSSVREVWDKLQAPRRPVPCI